MEAKECEKQKTDKASMSEVEGKEEKRNAQQEENAQGQQVAMTMAPDEELEDTQADQVEDAQTKEDDGNEKDQEKDEEKDAEDDKDKDGKKDKEGDGNPKETPEVKNDETSDKPDPLQNDAQTVGSLGENTLLGATPFEEELAMIKEFREHVLQAPTFTKADYKSRRERYEPGEPLQSLRENPCHPRTHWRPEREIFESCANN